MWRWTIMSFIYVPYQIQVITCNKLITDQNAIIQRNISHVTWHHGKEMCPDCSLLDCHIACLPKTFGGNPVKSNEKLFLHIIFCFQNYSDLLWEKKCYCDLEKTFEIRGWRSRICKKFQISRTIYSDIESSNSNWKQ